MPYDPAGFGEPDVVALPATQHPQIIGPRDKIRVTVFQVEDLSGEFNVEANGTINYPLIGQVTAQGKTSSELAQHLAQRLGERHLRSPNVQVAILEATEQTITVDGSVRQPGVVTIRGTSSLIQAVAAARGTSEDANPRRVLVFRTINGQRMAAAFDLQDIRRGQAEDPPIYGNDIIVVDGSRGRALFRDALATIPILGLFRPF
ncbi:MAG: polysaccharide biosynthesis/export family protein [Allosphingosinicella sp.]|uniref:polysaccharide biosynthesis/export family protein n=1 Tax=Allosphingosinicella sp. TaxID=2823234 RepID=UPI0039478D12